MIFIVVLLLLVWVWTSGNSPSTHQVFSKESCNEFTTFMTRILLSHCRHTVLTTLIADAVFPIWRVACWSEVREPTIRLQTVRSS